MGVFCYDRASITSQVNLVPCEVSSVQSEGGVEALDADMLQA